jgi:hypothetical protein
MKESHFEGHKPSAGEQQARSAEKIITEAQVRQHQSSRSEEGAGNTSSANSKAQQENFGELHDGFLKAFKEWRERVTRKQGERQTTEGYGDEQSDKSRLEDVRHGLYDFLDYGKKPSTENKTEVIDWEKLTPGEKHKNNMEWALREYKTADEYYAAAKERLARSSVFRAQFNEKLKEFFEKSAKQAQEKGANKLSIWQLVAMLLAGFLRGLKDETGEMAKETQKQAA